ncbi:hypothetical protein ANO11243_081750 [Dothideomycetidae sp. 11243]|nr:hypothetical protein ANO11243_081750 [fungal sp. No.11243]
MTGRRGEKVERRRGVEVRTRTTKRACAAERLWIARLGILFANLATAEWIRVSVAAARTGRRVEPLRYARTALRTPDQSASV